MEAIYLFGGLSIFGLIMIAYLTYEDWQYKKKHPEEK
jgi:hypothetical protein